jgi:hypothetical protein
MLVEIVKIAELGLILHWEETDGRHSGYRSRPQERNAYG